MKIEDMTANDLARHQTRILEDLLKLAALQTDALVRIAVALEKIPEA
jgi:hypothetical protein